MSALYGETKQVAAIFEKYRFNSGKPNAVEKKTIAAWKRKIGPVVKALNGKPMRGDLLTVNIVGNNVKVMTVYTRRSTNAEVHVVPEHIVPLHVLKEGNTEEAAVRAAAYERLMRCEKAFYDAQVAVEKTMKECEAAGIAYEKTGKKS